MKLIGNLGAPLIFDKYYVNRIYFLNNLGTTIIVLKNENNIMLGCHGAPILSNGFMVTEKDVFNYFEKVKLKKLRIKKVMRLLE